MSTKEYVIGIDLGTSNSCISIVEGGNTSVITNNEGKRTTPSVVGFMKNGEIKIGDPAKRQQATNTNTIFSVKRLMGKKFNELDKKYIDSLPYKVVNGNNGLAAVNINDKIYTPQEISAMILQKMKKTAEDYLGCDIKKAVITVPAYFGDSERTATKEAGEIAGLEVLRIINEPTAAALAYGVDKKIDKKIAVFDFGGGTFDISILDVCESVFEVLSTDGDVFLGGDNIDDAIVEWLINGFKAEHNTDLRKDTMAYQRLKEAAEKAKIELSSAMTTEINLPYITSIDNVPQHLVKVLNRSEFEKIIDSIMNKFTEPCERAIKNSGLSKGDIDEVILVGGSTRIPLVQSIVSKIFGKEPNKGVNPDESVAEGASIQGSVLSGDKTDILLLDVVPLNVSIETLNGMSTVMIEANSTIPITKEEVFTTAADMQPEVTIHILQGNRTLAKDNKSLGRFALTGIEPAPRGVPQVAVKISIDANGIMDVTASDKKTGKSQSIKITGNSNLSNEDIERMKKEAQDNEDADKKLKEDLLCLNDAENMIFTSEKQMSEFSDKLTDDDKSNLTIKINELKEVISKKDYVNIKKFKDELQQIWYGLSTKLYNTGGQEQPKQPEDTTQDVTFEDVK